MKRLKNQSYLKAKNLHVAIKNAKNLLIAFADKYGAYENFGCEQVSSLRSKFINSSDYSKLMNNYRTQIDSFSSWCMNYVEPNLR